MSAAAGPPETRGNGLARIVLGVVGVALVGVGAYTIWKNAGNWPGGLFAGSSALASIGFGVTLVLICAYYDEVEVAVRRLGIPRIKIRSRNGRTGADDDSEASA